MSTISMVYIIFALLLFICGCRSNEIDTAQQQMNEKFNELKQTVNELYVPFFFT